MESNMEVKVEKSCRVRNLLLGLFFLLFIFSPLLSGCGGGSGNSSAPGEREGSKSEDTRVWKKTFHKFGDETARSVQQTSDGGYIVAGSTAGYPPGTSGGAEHVYCYVMKLDGDGNTLWDRPFGKDGDGEANAVQQTSDGGYIVAGSAAGDEGSDFYVVKLNKDGVPQCEATFDHGGDEEAYAVQQTSDGGFIVAGSAIFDDKDNDIYVVKFKINSSHYAIEKEWDATFDNNGGEEEGYSIQQTGDGGYVVAGSTTSLASGLGSDVYIVKFTVNTQKKAVVDWTATFDYHGGNEEAHSIGQTRDGGYIAAGFTSSAKDHDFDCYIVNLRADGSEEWAKSFGKAGSYDNASSIHKTRDGGYIVAGCGGNDFYILKLNAQGEKSEDLTFGGSGNQDAKSIQQTADGGYIIAGTSTGTGEEDGDFCIVKIASLSQVPFN
ncbi:MAG: hypothetical protein AB1847_06065 [bacterium]